MASSHRNLVLSASIGMAFLIVSGTSFAQFAKQIESRQQLTRIATAMHRRKRACGGGRRISLQKGSPYKIVAAGGRGVAAALGEVIFKVTDADGSRISPALWTIDAQRVSHPSAS